MKANLSVILERWAELYDAIGHNRKSKDGKKEKAFYLIRAINEDNEFVRNQNTAKSPCIAYSIQLMPKVPTISWSITSTPSTS